MISQAIQMLYLYPVDTIHTLSVPLISGDYKRSYLRNRLNRLRILPAHLWVGLLDNRQRIGKKNEIELLVWGRVADWSKVTTD